jgi:polysaccharide export outer membrane protein
MGAAEQHTKEFVSHIEEAARGGPSQQPMHADDAGTGMSGQYRIGAGDVLQISVWHEADASVPAVVVRGDGNVSLPLVKDVAVVGLTPAEAEKVIGARLARYIHGADVTVIVREIHSQKIYMVGSVRTVGPVQMTGNMTVLQAITQAGGLTDYAKRKQIYILRTQNGKQTRLPFNYEAVIKGQASEQNIYLFPNDTVVVP